MVHIPPSVGGTECRVRTHEGVDRKMRDALGSTGEDGRVRPSHWQHSHLQRQDKQEDFGVV